jgi:3-dehydroquinate synthetase
VTEVDGTAGAWRTDRHISARSRLVEDGDVLRLESTVRRDHQVVLTKDVFSPGNRLLLDCLGDRDALVVTSPSVNRLYGRRIRDYVAGRPGTDVMVLDRSEATKSLDAAVEVVERAAVAGLRRASPIVAVGGGVCTDVCGLAAALHRRGVPHLKIPTTLVGLVDAGIGTKNAVNLDRHKSGLGTFHPPEHSLLDLRFIATLPRRQLANGMAEIIKLAIVKDEVLFTALVRHGGALLDSGFQVPEAAAERIVRLAVRGMLAELAQNQFEIADFRRKVDFGHTFSPHIEVVSGHSVLHGEAVAMDMALSAQLANLIGLLTDDVLERILSVIEQTGLALTWPGLSIDALFATLPSVAEHRNGDLHLVVPTGIGRSAFLGIADLSPNLLRTCAGRLVRRSRAAAPATGARPLSVSGGQ